MHKHVYSSALYHLIEAGQLARTIVLLPVQKMGLHAGDDAIILALHKKKPISDSQLCTLTGLTPDMMHPRLDRLLALSLIHRLTLGTELTPATRLSKSGHVLNKKLRAHWHELEDALMHDLSHKDKKHLKLALKRFADLLSL